MNIAIYPPQLLHEQGDYRRKNEDAIYPNAKEVKNAANVFLVCDGVGGSPCGEHASRIVADEFSSYFQNKQVSDAADVAAAVSLSEKAMRQFSQQHHEARKMATTMTLLHLHQNGATIAHIGDSRVYQFRQGKIVFKTSDHSWVEEQIRDGHLDAEAAKTHPFRNRVTKVIQCDRQGAQPDIELVSKVRADDYFFLCSDGILESLTDAQLEYIVSNANLDDKQKIETIQDACKERSKDNFSCYLIRIRSTDEPVQDDGGTTDKIPIQDGIPPDPEGAGFIAKVVFALLGLALIVASIKLL